eukprot:121417_1
MATEMFKFPYQKQESDFLNTYCSPYLHIRGMRPNERLSLTYGFIKNNVVGVDHIMQFNYNDIIQLVHRYIYTQNKEQNDSLYSIEVKEIQERFQQFEKEYMNAQPPQPKDAKRVIDPNPNPKNTFFRYNMTKWEAQYEENPLDNDRSNVFNIPKGIDAYFDYEMENDTNLMPCGNYMLIAPNRVQYILPGDTVFGYILHGGYRRLRPRGRWYFWADVEYLPFADEVYKRHNVQRKDSFLDVYEPSDSDTEDDEEDENEDEM